MPAGLNLVVCIWRFDYVQDDSVGGAQPTGTLICQNLSARISSQRPTTLLSAQGLETISMYSALVWPGNSDISENDQLEVTAPPTSPFYGWKFAILAVQHTSGHPQNSQGYLITTMRRKTEAHSVQSAY